MFPYHYRVFKMEIESSTLDLELMWLISYCKICQEGLQGPNCYCNMNSNLLRWVFYFSIAIESLHPLF